MLRHHLLNNNNNKKVASKSSLNEIIIENLHDVFGTDRK